VKPVADLGPPTVTINSGQMLTLSPGVGFASYLWSTNATTPSINVNTTNTYWVVVTDNHSCTASDTIIVTVIDGISESVIDKAVDIYPNPSRGIVSVRINRQLKNFELQITDVEGRIILTDSHSNNNLFNKNYDLSEYAKGIYYLRIFSADGNTTRTLIIQ
jgi:hypothetical protein